MAKKNLIARQKKREKQVKKYINKSKDLKRKIILENSVDKKLELHIQLQKFPRDSSPTRLHNRCLVTGRTQGYYRYFGLSRNVLREMAYDCLLPGLTKSSW